MVEEIVGGNIVILMVKEPNALNVMSILVSVAMSALKTHASVMINLQIKLVTLKEVSNL